MTSFADLCAEGFVSGDAGPLATRLFHRSQMEDGLHLHIGGTAIMAETLALAAMFDVRSATATAIDDTFAALMLSGTTQSLFGQRLETPIALTLTRHIWTEFEGKYALRLTAITDWAGLATAAGLDLAALATTLGARHPTHRPLGELASGRNSLEDNTALDALASATRRLLHQTSGTQSRCASSRANRVTFGATSG